MDSQRQLLTVTQLSLLAVALFTRPILAAKLNATGASVISPRRSSTVLVVLAHPDDEIFIGGVLANLSDRGVRVILACATKGEAGRPHPSVGAVEDLGALRAEELRVSCERLGIGKPVFLGFHDSGRGERQRHDDPRALANVDMLEVEASVRNVIQEVQPSVVLTFDPHGGYYHPDHVAIQRAATAAFFSSASSGLAAPERLFYFVLRRDVFRAFAQRMQGRGFTDGLDPNVFGTDPAMIAVSFNARDYLDRKFSALAAHRSAFGVTEEMLHHPSRGGSAVLDAFRPAFEQEDFVLGGTRVTEAAWPLHDFFDGLKTAEITPKTSGSK